MDVHVFSLSGIAVAEEDELVDVKARVEEAAPLLTPSGNEVGGLEENSSGKRHLGLSGVRLSCFTRSAFFLLRADVNGDRTGVPLVADPEPTAGSNWLVPPDRVEYDDQDRLVRYGARCFTYLLGGEFWRDEQIAAGGRCTDPGTIIATAEYRYDDMGARTIRTQARRRE